jgi:hypothetical protein
MCMTRRFQSAGASGKSASVKIEVPLRDARKATLQADFADQAPRQL